MRRIAASCLAVFFVAFAVSFASPRAAGRALEIGHIEAATPVVTVNARDLKQLPVRNIALELGDLVRTGPTGGARVALSGGSSLLLQEDTELRVTKHDPALQQTIVDMVRGVVVVQSVPDARRLSEMRIQTPTGVVSTQDGTVLIRTRPGSIGLGTSSLGVTLRTGSTPVIDAPIFLAERGVDGVFPIGRTDSRGHSDAVLDFVQGGVPDRTLAYPLIDYNRLVDERFRVVAETCDDGRSALYLRGEGAQLPEPGKKCKFRSMNELVCWRRFGKPSQQLTVDLALNAWTVNDSPPDPRPSDGVGTTVVTAFDRQVSLTGLPGSKSPRITYLLPGQAAAVDLGGAPSPAVRFDHPQLLDALDMRAADKNNWFVPGVIRDFTPQGQPCTPTWVLDGIGAETRSKYDVDIIGTGTSTGHALQIFGTNESDCPIYFMITDGTIMSPKGMTKRVLASVLTGSIPPLDNFQRMLAAGVFFRIPARAKDATKYLTSYCVDLHKLAPHQRTEYKVAGEDDQRMGWYRPIVDTGYRLAATGGLNSATGHTLDATNQWALWTEIEDLDPREFADEYIQLIKKNYDAQNKKWDNAAKKAANESMLDMGDLVKRFRYGRTPTGK